jgi:hypothetical protein
VDEWGGREGEREGGRMSDGGWRELESFLPHFPGGPEACASLTVVAGADSDSQGPCAVLTHSQVVKAMLLCPSC